MCVCVAVVLCFDQMKRRNMHHKMDVQIMNIHTKMYMIGVMELRSFAFHGSKYMFSLYINSLILYNPVITAITIYHMYSTLSSVNLNYSFVFTCNSHIK